MDDYTTQRESIQSNYIRSMMITLSNRYIQSNYIMATQSCYDYYQIGCMRTITIAACSTKICTQDILYTHISN